MPIPRKPSVASAMDALELLRADHEKMKALFRAFEALKDNGGQDHRKAELVDEICHELTLHALLEQEVFYPALRAAIGDDDLMDEADLDHAGAAELVVRLEAMGPRASYFDTTVGVLGAEVAHHIEQEEGEIFFAARDAGIDLGWLGERLATRRSELDQLFGVRAPQLNGAAPHHGAGRPPAVRN